MFGQDKTPPTPIFKNLNAWVKKKGAWRGLNTFDFGLTWSDLRYQYCVFKFSITRVVVARCRANAVALRGGDTKTLAKHGFASAAGDAKELLPGRQNFPSTWFDRCCRSVKGGGVLQVQRSGDVSGARGVLWRLSDLRAALV